MNYENFTTDRAKAYLLDNSNHYSEEDFRKADKEDSYWSDDIKEGDWVVDGYCGYPVNEPETNSAIYLANKLKYWSNPKNIDNYIDYTMSN